MQTTGGAGGCITVVLRFPCGQTTLCPEDSAVTIHVLVYSTLTAVRESERPLKTRQ